MVLVTATSCGTYNDLDLLQSHKLLEPGLFFGRDHQLAGVTRSSVPKVISCYAVQAF